MFQLVPPSVPTGPTIFDMGQVETHSVIIILPLVKQSQVNVTNYFLKSDQCPGTSHLSCDTKESFKFALFFCLQSYKEKVFHSAPVSPTITAKALLS